MSSEDWQGFIDHKKEKRKENLYVFTDLILPQIEEELKVKYDKNSHRYILHTEKFGIIDVFPEANKLFIRKLNKLPVKKVNKIFIRKDNRWNNNAIHWLIQTFKLEQ